MKLIRPVLLTACLALACGLAAAAEPAAAPRPTTWAKPVTLAGVPNLHQVSPTLYRSAQPTRDGMAGLEKLGVRTVVNLRSFNSDRDELKGTKLAEAHLFMKAWHPERKEVIEFLKIATDPKQGPVLIHCQHGADRTGTLAACYRVIVQGWTKEEAIREMTDGGYGFHEVWKNLPEWIADLDVEAIRKQLGIPKPPATPIP
jgi:protein tyrosine phosphatase (PTP) superfamily phosphohydrolase (DUF442 family)